MDYSGTHSVLRAVHIGAAFLGLAVFWLPIVVRKGGRLHVVCGRVFVVCAAVALATALVSCAWWFIDPFGLLPAGARPPADQLADFVRTIRLIFVFLAALTVYTAVPLVLAVRVIRTRNNPERLAGPGTRLLFAVQVVASLALIGYSVAQWIRTPEMLLCTVPLGTGISGLAAAWWDWRFVARPRFSPMFWWYKHMEFMLRTGIAFHTAFAVFGLKPLVGNLADGGWALVPWVMPSVVGVPATWFWIQHYRRKFGDLPTPPPGRSPELVSPA